jgi:hypothetical protein
MAILDMGLGTDEDMECELHRRVSAAVCQGFGCTGWVPFVAGGVSPTTDCGKEVAKSLASERTTWTDDLWFWYHMLVQFKGGIVDRYSSAHPQGEVRQIDILLGMFLDSMYNILEQADENERKFTKSQKDMEITDVGMTEIEGTTVKLARKGHIGSSKERKFYITDNGMLIYSVPGYEKSSGSLYLRGAYITPLPEQGRGQIAGEIQTTITPSGNAEPLTVLHDSMRLAKQFHDPVSQKIMEMAADRDKPQIVTLQKIIMSYPDTFKYGDVRYLVTDQFGGIAALEKENPDIKQEIIEFLRTQQIDTDILFLPTPLGLGWDDNTIIKKVCENECFVRDPTSGIVSLDLEGCIENITILLRAKMGMLKNLKQKIAYLKATGVKLDDMLSNPEYGINSGALASGHEQVREDVRQVYQDMFDEAPDTDPDTDQGQGAGGRSRYKKSRKKRRSKGKNRSKKRTRMKKKIKRRTKK